MPCEFLKFIAQRFLFWRHHFIWFFRLEEVEKCKNSDMLENLLKEMAGEFPLLSRIFVEERDAYMVNTLHTILRSTTTEKFDASKTVKGIQLLFCFGSTSSCSYFF